MTTDFLIVGAGLAGTSAALWLTDHGSVALLDAAQPGAGASGAAAGLVNPLMGRKAKPTWRFETALDALHATFDRADAAHLLRTDGLLRPARDTTQARTFRDQAEALPEHATWQSADELAERYPDLRAPHGGLWIRRGGAVDLEATVEAFAQAADRFGAAIHSDTRVTGWGEHADSTWVETAAGQHIKARAVILALGDGFRHIDALDVLGLHRIKGQTIRLARPPALGPLPPLSGFGYVVPEPASTKAGSDTLVVGSSYEHDFTDLAPSNVQSEALRAKAARMLPTLDAAPILDARAGVRVTVPGDRMPLLGPLPGRQRVWVFTGLGSKGLMTAPLLARPLPHYLSNPGTIPSQVRADRRRDKHPVR